MTADPELVTIFETKDEPEAMIVHSLLTSNGIDSLLVNLEAPQDVLPGVGGMAIRVNAAQADVARQVLEEYRNTPEAEEADEIDEISDEEQSESDGN